MKLHVDDIPCTTCGQDAAYIGYSNSGILFQCDQGHDTFMADE